MADDQIHHDTDEIWYGAGKVLALSMLVEQMFHEMDRAMGQYSGAFGTDPDDDASKEGLKAYLPRRDGGLQFCTNLATMVGLDGDAVRAAGSMLEHGDDEATEAAGGKRG